MENKQPTEISYYAHEAEVARLEVHNRRAFIFALIMFIALILTNAGWIIHESMYEDIVMTQDIDGGDGAVTVNGVGDINYGGENSSNNQDAP